MTITKPQSLMCRSSKESTKAELAAAEARGRADAEKVALQAALDSAAVRSQAEQSTLQATLQRLEADARDYKVRLALQP